MKHVGLIAVLFCILKMSGVQAAQIRGEYLEARTCDVYTGPCFANAEMGLAGKEALIAWRVEKGQWNNVALDGLTVAVVLNGENTLGDDGVFGMHPGRIDSLILVDDQADPQQRQALVDFAKSSSNGLADRVVQVCSLPMSLENDHLSGCGSFVAGDIARIETRGLKKGDCVCTNEMVYYQPLTKIKDSSPAYTATVGFRGDGLNNKWESRNLRSAFLGTFRK